MKKILCVCTCLALLVSLSACGITDMFTYKGAVNNYMSALIGEADEDTFRSLVPEEAWEYLDDVGYDPDDIVEQYLDSQDDIMDDLEDELGDDVKFSYTVDDEDELSRKEMEELCEYLEHYDVDTDDIKKAYELELYVTLEGDYDDEEDDITLIVYQLGYKWYVFESIRLINLYHGI